MAVGVGVGLANGVACGVACVESGIVGMVSIVVVALADGSSIGGANRGGGHCAQCTGGGRK